MTHRASHSRIRARSLRRHLMNWLFKPLLALLFLSATAGYLAALELANSTYDRVLIERAHLLASRLNIIPEGRTPRPRDLLPDAAPAEQAGHPRFRLFTASGQAWIGNANLPQPSPANLTLGEPKLSNARLDDRDIRLLSLRFVSHYPKPGTEYVLVMAEFSDERLFLGRSIVANIVVPQFIFVLIAAVAVWFGLKRGIEPLETLRRAVAARRSDDFRPLDTAMAPDEVRPLILEINALIERLETVLDSQHRFIANAAHQLRTPFAGLRAQAELARREATSPTLRASLEYICESTARCSRLVNQLLSLARNVPLPGDARMDWIDLNAIAEDSVREWVNAALPKDIDLGFEGPGHPLMMRGDEAALRDLISNLLDNAIRYTPSGGRVTLRAGPGTELAVEDSGSGIPEEERERIFDRFYRGTDTGQIGSGLGLAIVKEVVQRHHGTLRVDVGPNAQGTVFTVRFNNPPSRPVPDSP